MPKPKSVLLRLQVDTAMRAHNCQHNSAHRLLQGHKRLKLTKDRSDEHFCVQCGLEMIRQGIEKLQGLAAELEGHLKNDVRPSGNDLVSQ